MNIQFASKVVMGCVIGIGTLLASAIIEDIDKQNQQHKIVKNVNKHVIKNKPKHSDESAIDMINNWEQSPDDKNDEIQYIIDDDEDDDDEDDDDVEDEEDDDLDINGLIKYQKPEEEPLFPDAGLTDEGIKVYTEVKDQDEDTEDFETFDYHIADSTHIVNCNGTVFDCAQDVIDYFTSAVEYFRDVYSGKAELIESVVLPKKEVVDSIDLSKIPEYDGKMNLMDYMVIVDPNDIVNRKSIFGPKAPGSVNPIEGDIIEDDDSDAELTIDMVKTVVKKIFNDNMNGRLYTEFMENASEACEKNIEGIYPILNKYESLMIKCYDDITSGQPVNRRTWSNRFSKLFRKAKVLMVNTSNATEE